MFSLFDRFKMIVNRNNNSSSPIVKSSAVPKSNVANPTSPDWKQWQGKVMGTDQDIKEALETFKDKPPESLQQLQQVISEQRKTKLNENLEKGKNSFW